MSKPKENETVPVANDGMQDNFYKEMDAALEAGVHEAGIEELPEQETGWFGRVKSRVTKAAADVQDMLEGFVLYRVSKEVCASVAIEELERGTAKVILGLFWRVYDKYSTAKEGTAFYSFRHDQSKFWTTIRTAAIAAAFGVVSALFLRQAGIYRERGDEKSANLYDFIGRACIKAAFMEAGRAINVDAMIEGGLDWVVGMLPDIRKEVEEASSAIASQAEQAAKEARKIPGVKVVPPHGPGKGTVGNAA